MNLQSEDSPTDPQEPIRRITTSYPNDSRSPFFDPSGQEMKPMAKLHLTRQRIYEKTCENPTTDSSHSGGAPTHKQKHSKYPPAFYLIFRFFFYFNFLLVKSVFKNSNFVCKQICFYNSEFDLHSYYDLQQPSTNPSDLFSPLRNVELRKSTI